ncbi:MAG: hypothetical protein KJ601_07580 [Nanoarchaeota archaeon]|nr:hypothetical protein [Nanoarchaeota archaeon]MBU1704706.1 hypothetical protein [Nanoarchaeota archaeon]
MVEKKFVVEGLRFSYSGPFDVVEFYRYIDKWIVDHGMEKEIKKKSEHVTSKGRKIEWLIEIWMQPMDYAKQVVRLRALFDHVTEAKIKGRKLNKVEALIDIDAILETDIEGRWEQKPLFYFMRAVYDKLVNKFYTNRFEGKLTADAYRLHKDLTEFFGSYKHI